MSSPLFSHGQIRIMRSKASRKGKGTRVSFEERTTDTFPLARPAGSQNILFTPTVRSRVRKYTWAYDVRLFE
jgi:hypothetical protein